MRRSIATALLVTTTLAGTAGVAAAQSTTTTTTYTTQTTGVVVPTTGIVTTTPGIVRTDAVPFQANAKLDMAGGTWGNQPLTPPLGLASVTNSDLIGRNIADSSGTNVLTIEKLLVEPATGNARYAVTSMNHFSDKVVIPFSAMQISPMQIRVDASKETLANMPKFASSELDRNYPATTLTQVVIVPSTSLYAPVVGQTTPLPPVPVMASTVTTTTVPVGVEPLQLARRGSVVGQPVYDSLGQSVGVVSAVAAAPSNGEVRYVLVSGPSFGAGNDIAIPAASASAASGRVVLSAPLAQWQQAPRYRAEVVPQVFGSLGTIN